MPHSCGFTHCAQSCTGAEIEARSKESQQAGASAGGAEIDEIAVESHVERTALAVVQANAASHAGVRTSTQKDSKQGAVQAQPVCDAGAATSRCPLLVVCAFRWHSS